jgi:hypothetical protein|tara:strand:+ start:2535 stop:2765 length:231 start_codon:yes stop_codon:yes gene_type:complete
MPERINGAGHTEPVFGNVVENLTTEQRIIRDYLRKSKATPFMLYALKQKYGAAWLLALDVDMSPAENMYGPDWINE